MAEYSVFMNTKDWCIRCLAPLSATTLFGRSRSPTTQAPAPAPAAALAASMSQPGGIGGLGAALAGAGLAGIPSNVGVLEKTTDNEDTKSDCSEKGPRRKSTTPQQYLGSHDESTND